LEYQQLFESMLEDFIANCGSSIADFYKQIKSTMENDYSSNQTKESSFLVDILITSVDFNSFLTTIVEEARKVNLKN